MSFKIEPGERVAILGKIFKAIFKLIKLIISNN